MSEKKENYFNILNRVDVNDKVCSKNGLKYLSWAWAWGYLLERCPGASYEIVRYEGGLPYVCDEATGYMVSTRVTLDGLTREMWLPVMDAFNRAMKCKPYSYKVKEYVRGRPTGKFIDKHVEAATMFDINKTIMRCLVKNIAMFGLGLYIYAGEDLPEAPQIVIEPPKEYITDSERSMLQNKIAEANKSVIEVCEHLKISSLSELPKRRLKKLIDRLDCLIKEGK